MQRREFLGRMAAGGAVVTMPLFLSACGVNQARVLTETPPANPFLDWFSLDQAAIARVMAELTARGADMAELYFQHRRASVLTREDGNVGRADAEITQGVGVRVVSGGQTGFAYSEDLSLPAMLETARSAASIASGGSRVPPQHYRAQQSGDLYTIELPWEEVGVAQKLPLLQRLDEKARQADPSVEQVSVHWSDTDDRVLIATLDGRLIMDRRPLTRLSAQVTARRGGNVQSGYANISARQDLSWYSDERIARLAAEAVERTLIQFDARRPPAGEMPVILAAGTSGILLHEAIGHSLEADFNRDRSSVYADSLGEQVAAGCVTLVDQGTIPHARGALNYDDEGTACGRTVLVADGVLRSYLHDGISARHYQVATTGSGRRESYRYPPMPRMSCTFMENGPHDRDEMVAAIDRGIVAETYTGVRVQPGAGDFRFRVGNGWLIENGRLTAPLKDFDIAGNGPELLRNITMVAGDGQLDRGGWTCGKNGQRVPVSHGMPTALVSGLGVGIG